jgi:hypothetical protein
VGTPRSAAFFLVCGREAIPADFAIGMAGRIARAAPPDEEGHA